MSVGMGVLYMGFGAVSRRVDAFFVLGLYLVRCEQALIKENVRVGGLCSVQSFRLAFGEPACGRRRVRDCTLLNDPSHS